MKLCGLDFRNENFLPGSICAVGTSLVEDSIAIAHLEYLIKPHKTVDYQSDFCYNNHHIAYEDLRESLEFPIVWSNIASMIRLADGVVFPNANSCLYQLKEVLKLYNLPSIQFNYLCCTSLFQYHFPKLDKYSLEDMAKYFGIKLEHFDALETAQIVSLIASFLEIPDSYIGVFEHIQKD